ncbi:MAG: methyltransferase domain-containing protein [Acidobacteria bacterium]|nr:methyltransferase domain-containing protein [Acidobacteriota bacterium]
MNFTGERFIPGEGGCQIAYEHLHRYYFALRWAKNNEVLDLACGNGYGAALLARHARRVWALDLDDDTIQGACKNWQRDNLTFLRGNATQLPFRSGSIDVVVTMEALEHIKDQEELLREISRVSSANGVVLISTPNKAAYSDARQYVNPFHTRELYPDEFVSLLKQHFRFVEIAGQQIRAGSLISSISCGSSSEVFLEKTAASNAEMTEPMYYLAVCSMSKLSEQMPSHSAFLDSTDGLIFEWKQEVIKLNEEIGRLGLWAKDLEAVISERDQVIRDLQARMDEERARMDEEIHQRDRTIQDLQDQLVQEVVSRDQAIRSLQQEMRTEIADRDQRIIDLLDLLHQKEKEFDDRGKWALALQAEVEHLNRIRRALLYRILSRLGLLPK